jgi:hypothetical protein
MRNFIAYREVALVAKMNGKKKEALDSVGKARGNEGRTNEGRTE